MVPDVRLFSQILVVRKNDHKTVHKTYINTLGVPHCHVAMGIFVHFALNWTTWHLVPWPLEHNCPNQSKALVISKSFSSFLIGCVRCPTPRTDKGSSSITDNMITFNGISVLNFKFAKWWQRLTWSFGSGELKKKGVHIISYPW
jgi:hypothetical protein